MGTPVTVKIKFKSDSVDQFIAQYSSDVSEGGIFIRTPRPLSSGTHLTFHFQLSDGSPLLTGNGTVVWIREEGPRLGNLSAGMGVRFDSLPPEGQAIIGRVLSQKQSGDQFEEDLPTRVAPEAMRQQLVQEQVVAQSSPDLAVGQIPDVAQAETMRAPAQQQAPPAPAMPKAEPETEDDRRDRLEKILFASQDEAKSPESDGALPLADGRGEEGEEPAVVPTSPYAGAAAREQKSSALGWVILLLMIVGGAVAYYFLVMQKQSVEVEEVDIPLRSTAAPSAQAEPEAAPRVTVQVTSTPDGARIWLDGTDTGKTTPAELADLDPEQEAKIDFDLPGKKLVTVREKPTADSPIDATLDEESKRSIVVTSSPEGATVILNGRRIGKAPLTYDKPLKGARPYAFKVVLRGHKTHAVTIKPDDATWERDIDGDEVLKLSAELEASARKAAKTPRKPKPSKAKPKSSAPSDRPADKPKAEADPKPKAEPKAEAKPKAEPKAEPKPEAKPEGEAPKKPSIKLPSWGD